MTPAASLVTIEFDRVLALIAMEAKSAPGKDAIARRRPHATLEACEKAQGELAEIVRFIQSEGLLPLAGLTGVAPLFDRESVLELDESWVVVRAARATQSVRETFLRSDGFPLLTRIAREIPDLGELLSHLGRYFTRDGTLREEASAALRAIRGRIQSKRAAIQRVLSEVMNRHAEAIQEPLIVQRGDRYCVPVRAGHRSAVAGILHERSGSGASVFIEPMQAVELNNDLAELLIEEREEIGRITRHVSSALFDQKEAILGAVAVAGEFDALQACALFHEQIGASRPSFSTRRELRLLDARHPLLDERLSAARVELFGEKPAGQKVVPVTVELDEHHSALVISGPNAGGKTVALKTAGLLVAMATSGLPLPAAEGSVIPVVDAIHVLIGDEQDVLEHLSTFSAYLVRLARILEQATERSLVLLDELGSGTDPEEGAALAAAVVEHILERGALLIVTTHLSSLKTFAVNDPRIVNASMEFDAATGRPTYRMIAGIPGRSRAIDAARSVGLPAAVIERARERLGDRYGSTDELLSRLQQKMAEVLAQLDAAERLRREMENERAALASKQRQLEQERARLGTWYREELERLRDDVQRQLAAEIRNLREMDRAARAHVAPSSAAEGLTRQIERAIEFVPVEQREVRAGDRAEHRKFKVRGNVVSIDGKKAVLAVDGRKMTVELRDLVPIERKAERPTRHAASAGSGDDAVVVSAELNLIGQRVDDAIEESDRFLDRALLEGRRAVRIIHGFGTGALRKAIREHLRNHPAVKSWRPGGDNEGGDGATVAELDT
ncbi:MAG TPA: Smr/MutS family protein [Thermoanaerobaculia bacterium]|nr:Smr/MutS family protein [Thermoanaerobaculia bacterium]